MRIAKSIFAGSIFLIVLFANAAAFDASELFVLKESPKIKSVEQRSSIASVREAEIVIGTKSFGGEQQDSLYVI